MATSKKSNNTAVVQVAAIIEDDDDFEFKKKKLPSPFTQHLPPERVWPTAAITERAIDLLTWVRDCQTLVDCHFGSGKFTLVIKPITNYWWITMQSKTQTRVYAFVAKATADIHCPALYDEPFAAAHGNVRDAVTRLSIMGAWGVTTQWSWLPTYPGNDRFSKMR